MSAPTVVQVNSAGNPFGSATSRTCSFTTLPAAGHPVVVSIADRNNFGGSISSVADNQGNTYTLINTEADASNFCRISHYWCSSIGTPSGTFTVTVAYTAAQEFDFGIAEVAPPSGSGAVVVDQQGVTTVSSATSITVNASAANTNATDLVLAAMACQNTGSNTVSDPPTSGYTSWWSLTAYSPSDAGYKTTSAVETSSASWTISSASAAAAIVTFKGVTSTGPNPSQGFFSLMQGAVLLPLAWIIGRRNKLANKKSLRP